MATDALSMSLDDIIKNNKKSGASNARSRSRNSGPGPSRRLPSRRSSRPGPYSSGPMPVEAPDTTWKHDMFADEVAAAAPYPGRAQSIETGTKLYITNLDYRVSNEDIKELFSEVGDIKRHSIHYDRSGRSKGTAEVVFSRRADALVAIKKYNNIQLDGKPMKIEIITPAVVPPATKDSNGKLNSSSKRSQEGRGAAAAGRARRGRRRRGPRQGKASEEKFSAEDLDADLEKYHAEAMEVN